MRRTRRPTARPASSRRRQAMLNGDFSGLGLERLHDHRPERPGSPSRATRSRVADRPHGEGLLGQVRLQHPELRPELHLPVRQRAQGLELQRPRRLQHQPAPPPDAVRLLLRQPDDLARRPRPEHLGRRRPAAPPGTRSRRAATSCPSSRRPCSTRSGPGPPKSNLVIETRAAYSEMPEKVVLAEDSLGTTLETLGANDPLPRTDAPAILPTIGHRQVVGRQRGRGPLQRLDDGLHGQEPDPRLLGHLDQGLAQHQGRRGVPGRQLQHHQAGPREQQRR